MNIIFSIILLIFSVSCQVKTQDSSSVVSGTNGTNFSTSLTATNNILADGITTSTVTVNIKRGGTAWAGSVPTLSSTGTNNTFGICSSSDALGNSTCTFKSTKAEVKSLSVLTPAASNAVSVTFLAGAISASTSTISAGGPAVANGMATSTISIYLRDVFGNPVGGATPTFSATNTGSTNSYGLCSVANATGLSTCTLSSTKAESKTLNLLTPVALTGSAAVFVAGPAVAANTTITATSPIVADGIASSLVTVAMKDFYNNPLIGTVPTFSATNTGSTNIYGVCSSSDTSGESICSLKSTKSEIKTLNLLTPITKTGGTTTFVAGSPNAMNSTITGSGAVTADGVATSTVTITLLDALNNPIVGQVPTFDATNTGTTNTYGICPATNALGVSTCTLSSTKAETKTLAIATPVVKTGTTVVFNPGSPSSLTTVITGTTPVDADGISSSVISINVKDSFNNAIPGVTPIFNATNTGSTNIYGSCTASDATGLSTCSLASTVAEVKTLQLTSPVAVTGSTVTFESTGPVAINSNISGTTTIVADGVATSTITITLRDIFNNPVAGQLPTFSATDGGTNNIYGTCSTTNISGVSTCTMSSLKAETKILSIDTPIIKSDASVIFVAGASDATNSTITGLGPVVADGVLTSTVTITLKDLNNNLVAGVTPTFSATDTGTNNAYGSCSVSSVAGVSTCTLSSETAESKILSISTPVIKADGTVLFTAGPAVAINSNIIGSGPVVADGIATSTVTITLKDLHQNIVEGETPTFNATDTGTTNVYGTCSATDSSGISTCTLASLGVETKTLSIATPVTKSDGTVVFTPGAPVAANSTITGTGPVVANGTATSTVTITLKDINNHPVSGQTPTFNATDTGTTNTYTACSISDVSGISTCTLKSTKAETKTLSIATPVVKAGGTVIFTAGSAVAVNSSITGTGPVIADGTATSTVTITLKDAFNNLVSGQTPTFSSTDTGTTNSYGNCSVTDALGISTCTLSSLKAETKTLSIATPVVKADGTIVFTAGSAVALNSSITGTGPVIANGTATSTVTVSLKDANSNNVSGIVPTFTATNTGSTNIYGTCSATDALGVSTCTLASNNAEIKTLSIATPVVKADGTVLFNSSAPVAINSTITGTGSVIADGVATSTVTITLRDISLNPVSGQTPTFSATDAGTTNTYGTCSLSNASGISTCTLSSLKAETKTLSIVTPVAKSDGTVIFIPGSASALNSTITGTGPVVADGTAATTVTITLKDANSNNISGVTPTFSATNTGSSNTYTACSVSDAGGIATCTMKSTKAEIKTLSIATPVVKADGTVTFTAGAAVATNSTITGTGPIAADGTATSTVTITLKDINSNNVSGQTPTFTATNTGTSNIYGTCSVSNTSGVSTCTLASTNAETKTLSIATPVVKTDGTVVFTAGSAVAANSTITGTGPVIANGTATSTVTITLNDINNNPVAGQTPTFSATDTGTTNVYLACSASDGSGVSTCTMKSTKAETKTLSIATPVIKAGGTVVFTAGSAVAINSTITGTGTTIANGTATSTVTITLKDASNNNVSGVTPTFTATNTGSTNTYTACSSSDASGISTCTLKSTKAETKTLSIATPFIKAGGTVVFIAGSPDVAHSDITGSSPVSADGVSVSFISVALNDAFSNPVSGITPIFNATDTGSNNTYGACSITDATGVATCSLASTKAEVKTLQLTSPIAVTGSTTVTFSSLLPVAMNSTITGTGPIIADGTNDSTVTITLKDSNNNAVSGITPTFDATDTGSGNVYDSCSMSDAGGVAICSFSSTKSETKTLRITNPVTKSDGTVIFTAGAAVALNSTISGTGPVIANGTATSTITIVLKDAGNNPVIGSTPTFSATNTASGNTQTACSVSDATGTSTCTLKSTKAENKTPQVLTPINKSGAAISFIAGTPVALNSTITGTGPVNPDGTSTSTITVTLKDTNSNNVSGVVPTFSASGTNNTYGTCSSTDIAGVSTCTMSSTTAETKTLSIATPVVKADGTVVFQSGSAVALNSTITGTGPVTANGVATSTVTVTLKDSGNAAVVGIVPTFTASGTVNTYTACSATNASGIATCTLKSTKAETKTLSIASPVVKTDGTVIFEPGAPSAVTSTVVASTPTLADGTDSCGITVTIKDANNNPIPGQVPTYTISGTSNTPSTCTTTDTAGESFCSVTSTKAEEKTVNLVTPVVLTGNTVDFNPNGIDMQVPIELIDRGLASSTTAITFTRSRTTFDPADYVADTNTYMFEVVADNINTTTTYTIYLVDSAGTVITDSAIAVPPNTTQKRFSVLWTPNSAADNYRVKVPATTAAGQVKVHSAKIIVDQIKAVATKIYIPLTSGDVAGENATDTSSTNAQITSNATVTFTANTYMNLWTRTDSSYDAIASGTPWTLETITNTSNAAGIASAALFDKTNNLQITPAITTVTGSTALTLKTVSFASNAANFDNGDIMELRIKSNSTSYTTRIYKAGLWLKLKFLKKSEVYFRLVGRRSATTTAALPDGRFLWEAGAWSNPTVYFQTNASLATSSTSLNDHANNDVGTTSPTVVSGSTLTPTATYAIQRSSALSLTNMDRFFVTHTRTAGTAVLGGAFLVIRAQE